MSLDVAEFPGQSRPFPINEHPEEDFARARRRDGRLLSVRFQSVSSEFATDMCGKRERGSSRRLAGGRERKIVGIPRVNPAEPLPECLQCFV